MKNYLLGTNKDILLDKINRFTGNLYNIKSALVSNNFPALIAYIAYLPIFLIVSILNLIRNEILTCITYFVVLMISIVFVGILFGILIMAIKGLRIYTENHGDAGFEET